MSHTGRLDHDQNTKQLTSRRHARPARAAAAAPAVVPIPPARQFPRRLTLHQCQLSMEIRSAGLGVHRPCNANAARELPARVTTAATGPLSAARPSGAPRHGGGTLELGSRTSV